MNKVLELIPISRLRQEQNEVLKRLAEGPALLTQYGDAAAVLVDPDQWNQIVEELETWMDSFDALAHEPRPPGCKKLRGGAGWRVRVGDYRGICQVDDSARIVTVLRAGHRRDIYRGR